MFANNNDPHIVCGNIMLLNALYSFPRMKYKCESILIFFIEFKTF